MTSDHKLDGAAVRSTLQRYIDELGSRYTWVEFDAMRSSYQDACSTRQDVDTQSQLYADSVEAMAIAIRVAAFDSMVDELAEGKVLNGDDAATLLEVIKAAGIKIIKGDIHVVEWPLSLTPTVFHEDAYRLFF